MKLRFIPILVLLLCFAAAAGAQPQPPLDAAHLRLAIDRLNVVGSVLYVAAHPDDENTALLAYMENGRLVRTGYLALTRGDGGQNLIGSEKGDLLGVIRTEELLAARKIDGAEQFFTRAIDFGYSKNPEESLAIWGKDKILSDVVWVIRRFRPDVIITRFPTTGEGGHGHHTASAILAQEAFRAAADANAFPEQLKYPGVSTWQAKRILWNAWQPKLENRPADAPRLYSLDLGSYNTVLGKSYSEIAADSRSMHKSQGFGTAERRGSQPNYFQFISGTAPAEDILDGIDMSWKRIPHSTAVAAALRQAADRFDATDPAASIPALVEAHHGLAQLLHDPATAPWKPMLEWKMQELESVIRSAAGLWIEAIADSPSVVPGGTAKVTTTIVNRSPVAVELRSIVPNFGAPQQVEKKAESNVPLAAELAVNVPASTPVSQPYWLANAPSKGTWTVNDQTLIGRAEGDPPLSIRFTTEIAGEEMSFTEPVYARSVDRVRGEEYELVRVIPPAILGVGSHVVFFPTQTARRVDVALKSNGATGNAVVRIVAPQEWTIMPRSRTVALPAAGAEAVASFDITPPVQDPVARFIASADIDGTTVSRSEVVIDYPHIPKIRLFPTAESKLVRTEVRRRGDDVGYIMGSGDEVPNALSQIGYRVTMLSDEDIASADLSQYQTIVAGVRAYNVRDALKRNNARLMKYVENGGTFVVQYNTFDKTMATDFAPYPIELSNDRVTVEDAPVTLVTPSDPVLTYPNAIGAADFEGWVQERGLYFAKKWDDHYRALLSSHDPGEKDLPGGTLVAPYGKGMYVYTAWSWFRQLPAGVPGAYRIFTNLVSARK